MSLCTTRCIISLLSFATLHIYFFIYLVVDLSALSENTTNMINMRAQTEEHISLWKGEGREQRSILCCWTTGPEQIIELMIKLGGSCVPIYHSVVTVA
jgi:hypothetical protein